MAAEGQIRQTVNSSFMRLTSGPVDGILLSSFRGEDDLRLVSLSNIDFGLAVSL